jgi:uncharacterized protein involved in tolerance to divalent cations
VVVEATVSAPSEAGAEALSRALVEARLVAGTRITVGKSHYHWDGAVRERDYWNLTAYTLPDLQEAVVAAVEERHPDDAPIVTFHPVEGNEAFERWVADVVEAP